MIYKVCELRRIKAIVRSPDSTYSAKYKIENAASKKKIQKQLEENLDKNVVFFCEYHHNMYGTLCTSLEIDLGLWQTAEYITTSDAFLDTHLELKRNVKRILPQNCKCFVVDHQLKY